MKSKTSFGSSRLPPRGSLSSSLTFLIAFSRSSCSSGERVKWTWIFTRGRPPRPLRGRSRAFRRAFFFDLGLERPHGLFPGELEPLGLRLGLRDLLDLEESGVAKLPGLEGLGRHGK